MFSRGKVPRDVYVELEFLRLEFHVNATWTPTWLETRVCETRFTKSETESQRLDFGKLTALAIVMSGHVCEIGHVPMFFVCFGRYM